MVHRKTPEVQYLSLHGAWASSKPRDHITKCSWFLVPSRAIHGHPCNILTAKCDDTRPLPRSAPRITVSSTWQAQGMRISDLPWMCFDHCHVDTLWMVTKSEIPITSWYPRVNVYIALEKHIFLIGKLTMSTAMLNSKLFVYQGWNSTQISWYPRFDGWYTAFIFLYVYPHDFPVDSWFIPLLGFNWNPRWWTVMDPSLSRAWHHRPRPSIQLRNSVKGMVGQK